MNPLFQMGHRALGPSIFEIGRPGGAAPPAPNWYDPIVETLTSGGATGYLWLRETGIATTVGQPVQDWEDVTGAVAWSQPGVSSLRPILQAGGLVFDGIDDRLNAGAAFDTLLAGSNWTLAIGVVTSAPSTLRVYWATTDGSTANRYNAVANNDLGAAASGAGASIFGAATATLPTGVWFVRNGTAYIRRLNGADSVGAWAGNPVGLSLLTLGARRAPSAGVFFSGSVSWVLATTRSLSTSDMSAISSVLATQGYSV